MHAAGQEVVVPTAQRVVVARAWISCNAAVQHCLENFGLQHSDLELEGSARTVVLFEGILPKAAAPGVAYAPVYFDQYLFSISNNGPHGFLDGSLGATSSV